MTRATLLHVLDCPTALGPAEVRELEQLAQAFPYCQTAHLLLAKAAHDQGTMLAGQRLRRAATYAADRALLRRLIEQVEPAAAAAETASLTDALAEENAGFLTGSDAAILSATTATAPGTRVSMEVASAPAPAPVSELAQLLEIESSLEPKVSPAQPAPIPAIAEMVMPALVEEPAPAPQPEPIIDIAPQQLPEAKAIVEHAVAPTVTAVAPELEAVNDPEAAVELPAVSSAASEEGLETDIEPILPSASSNEATDGLLLLVDRTDNDIAALEAEVELQPTEAPETAVEADLPAQAPAIRPPEEVGEARFEFGLAETPPPSKPSYELPGLVDEWAASAVTRSLGSVVLSPEPLPVAAPVTYSEAAFVSDLTVGYALGGSSRLGFAMQFLDLLTNQAETTAWPTEPAAACPPGAALPPVGAFFEPDLLVQHHWAAHCPPAPVLPSSLDLINNFLRRQPRLTRPAMLPPAASHQADLSVRSTRAEPDLVSENLARIFVRQGKIGRAVEIYEKLMVKQPEKLAYFAAQIQQLQPSA